MWLYEKVHNFLVMPLYYSFSSLLKKENDFFQKVHNYNTFIRSLGSPGLSKSALGIPEI